MLQNKLSLWILVGLVCIVAALALPPPDVDITPRAPAPGDDIVCEVNASTTANEFSYSWWYRSSINDLWNLHSTNIRNSFTDTLSASDTSLGEHWKCEVTADDGVSSVDTTGGCVVVQNPPTGATWTMQWCLPFGKYNVTPPPPKTVANKSSLGFDVNARCLFGECGDSEAQLLVNQTRVSTSTLVNTTDPNPVNGSTLPCMDTLESTDCLASWNLQARGAANQVHNVTPSYCSNEYGQDVPCRDSLTSIITIQDICNNVTSLTVVPSSVKLFNNQYIDLQARRHFNNGSIQDISTKVIWSA